MKNDNLIIITGGNIDYNFAIDYLNKNSFDIVIAVDKGLEFCHRAKVMPHYIMGDFDSINKTVLDEYRSTEGKSVICAYDSEKDYTDTHLAVNKGVELGSKSITILGGTGIRIDHVLANVGLLVEPLSVGIPCFLIDANNKIYLINRDILLRKNELFGKYVSLHPLTEKVKGITLTGFKYPLSSHTFCMGGSLGISNEVIEEEGIIHLEEGILIVVESKD